MLMYEVKANGRAGYEFMTGHKAKHKVCGFGQYVRFKVASNKCDIKKYDGEWDDGYFVGVVTRSSEYVLVSGDRVFKCPTVRRMVAADSYNKQVLRYAQAGFFQYVRKGASAKRTDVIQHRDQSRHVPEALEHEYVPRRMYLGKKDLVKRGYSARCPACAWYQIGKGTRSTHNAEAAWRRPSERRGAERRGWRDGTRMWRAGRQTEWRRQRQSRTGACRWARARAKGE